MARLPACLDMLPVLVLLLGNGIFGEETEPLMCDCTEQDCLSHGSAMCLTTPSLGCYKEYYSKSDPPVVMGCVKSLLLCDHYKMRPLEYSEDWPYTACCFTNHCNRHLETPYDHLPRSVNATTEGTATERPTTVYAITPAIVAAESVIEGNTNSMEENSASQAHPVFLLLIVLVVFFLLVVIASILVIVKIWFYRHQKPKEMNVWKVGQQNVPSNMSAQRAYLLTHSSSRDSSQQTSTNTLLETFDVP